MSKPVRTSTQTALLGSLAWNESFAFYVTERFTHVTVKIVNSRHVLIGGNAGGWLVWGRVLACEQ